MRGAVEGNDVFTALLKQQDSRRILPSVVDRVRVAAHTEVKVVATDRVTTRAPHGQAPTRKKRAVVVVDLRVDHPRKQDSILRRVTGDLTQHHLRGVAHRESRAMLRRPLAFIVLVGKQPILRVFRFERGEQSLRVVARDIELFKGAAIACGG